MGTKASAGRVLLWVDDDGPQRFLYEEYMLQIAGWTVRWAQSVRDAMKSLESECFDAILLDQMLPFGVSAAGASEPVDVWGGCLLLYWLRGLSRPSAAPPTKDSGADLFGVRQPLAGNREALTIIVSAFYDDEVDGAIEEVPGVRPLFSKPIEIQQLLEALKVTHG